MHAERNLLSEDLTAFVKPRRKRDAGESSVAALSESLESLDFFPASQKERSSEDSLFASGVTEASLSMEDVVVREPTTKDSSRRSVSFSKKLTFIPDVTDTYWSGEDDSDEEDCRDFGGGSGGCLSDHEDRPSRVKNNYAQREDSLDFDEIVGGPPLARRRREPSMDFFTARGEDDFGLYGEEKENNASDDNFWEMGSDCNLGGHNAFEMMGSKGSGNSSFWRQSSELLPLES